MRLIFLVAVNIWASWGSFAGAPPDSGKEAFFGLKGEKQERRLDQLGNVVFYFYLELEGCFKPLDEIIYYEKIQKAYPNLATAIVFDDPGGAFSKTYPNMESYLRERFHYSGPIYFDREGWVVRKYGIDHSPKIFVFDKEGKLVNILSPADTEEQKQRVRYYFELARQHI